MNINDEKYELLFTKFSFFFKRDFSARKRSERVTIVQRVNHTRPVYRITRGYTQAAEAF